ncbi:hypothetical protein BXZ70DRAFT_3101 [Cristinia sonorae]|uniref:Protein SQS1 n=1 Tax=Cristinia sonorae TaxID=1940300 RepID=A0A8K0XUG8_9AGAR|nr:hypothetical protein BXZ70DRAFT_3101 [Cristinia sonorae]
MARRKHAQGPRGGGGAPDRGGSSNGRGRGGGARGRGRGFEPHNGAGRGRGRGGYIPMDEIEQPIQMWTGGAETPERFGPRGRGRRGRGGNGYNSPRSGFSTPGRGAYTPRRGPLPIPPALEEVPGLGRGNSSFSPRGRRGGRGGRELASQLRGGAPLSKVLYDDRPYLRPVKFVRSVFTATLFKDEEELLQPIVEASTNNEASHVPTAEQVAHIFSGDAEAEAEGNDKSGEEELEEIDFSDIARIQAEVDAAAATRREEVHHASQPHDIQEQFTGFYVDTTPAQATALSSSIAVERVTGVLGEVDDDDEVIVYVAPLPRAGPVTPPPIDPEPVSNMSILTGLVCPSSTATDAAILAAIEAMRNESPESVEEPSGVTPYWNAIVSPAPESLPLPPPSFLRGKVSRATPAFEVEPEKTPQTPRDDEHLPSSDVLGEEVPEVHYAIDEVPAVSAQPEVAAGPSEPAVESPKETVPPTSSVPPTFDSVSFSFSATPRKKNARRLHPVNSPRSLLHSRRTTRHRSLRSFGAIISESYLRDEGRERDPRRDEQRRGDSDVDWGDDSDDEVNLPRKTDIDQISDGMGGMDLDGDLDVNAMKSFVQSMSAEGSRQMTMDDIADIERMKQEDEEESGSDEDVPEQSTEEEDEDEEEEIEAVMQAEERALTGDGTAGDEEPSSDDDTSSDEDEDENVSPRQKFKNRLEKVRSKVKGKQRAKSTEDDHDDHEDFDMDLDVSWADNDEAYLAKIQTILDQNEGVVYGRDRKQRKDLFKAIQDGDWDSDEYETMMGKPATRKKDKGKNLPADLQAQWERDREKKAENKRKRALARAQAAADPLVKKKGGKKGMKAMLQAAQLDSDEDIPNTIVNLVTLEQQIRRFLNNIGGPQSMVLPPANKHTRKQIHELAEAFSLKSVSKGKGNTRYTTLSKTTRSGLNIKEGKVRRILREVDGNWQGPERRGDRIKATSLAKHREGEEVGKSAPKIGESNIGFKMLAAMGWAEGDQIGLSGGLDAPLVAVMKKTKLGLGATL